MQNKTIKNIAKIHPEGMLGDLFSKAQKHNNLNIKLKKLLSIDFKELSLILIEKDTAYIAAKDAGICYLANKEKAKLLSKIRQIEGLDNINCVTIKVISK